MGPETVQQPEAGAAANTGKAAETKNDMVKQAEDIARDAAEKSAQEDRNEANWKEQIQATKNIAQWEKGSTPPATPGKAPETPPIDTPKDPETAKAAVEAAQAFVVGSAEAKAAAPNTEGIPVGSAEAKATVPNTEDESALDKYKTPAAEAPAETAKVATIEAAEPTIEPTATPETVEELAAQVSGYEQQIKDLQGQLEQASPAEKPALERMLDLTHQLRETSLQIEQTRASEQMAKDVEGKLSDALAANGMKLDLARTTERGYEIIITKGEGENSVGGRERVTPAELSVQHPDVEQARLAMIGVLVSKFAKENPQYNPGELAPQPTPAAERGPSFWEKAKNFVGEKAKKATAALTAPFNFALKTLTEYARLNTEAGKQALAASQKELNRVMQFGKEKIDRASEWASGTITNTRESANRVNEQIVLMGTQKWTEMRQNAIRTELLGSIDSLEKMGERMDTIRAKQTKLMELRAKLNGVSTHESNRAVLAVLGAYERRKQSNLHKLQAELLDIEAKQPGANDVKQGLVAEYAKIQQRLTAITNRRIELAGGQPTNRTEAAAGATA